MKLETPMQYLLAGAVVGLLYGALAVLQGPSTGSQDWSLGLGFGLVIGAFMGLELYHTRRWNRFGWPGWYARWAVAGASGFGAAGSLLVLTGQIPRWGAWAASAFGLVAGLGFGFEARDPELLKNSD
jgi:hypothetical protein